MRVVMPARVRRGRRSASRGGAAIEFALILPLFLMVLFGIIDYGYYFYQRYALVAAIRDGVRYGATYSAASAWSKAKARAITDLQAPGSPINYLSVAWNLSPGTSVLPAPAPALQVVTLGGSMPFTPMIGFVRVPALVKYQMTMLVQP